VVDEAVGLLLGPLGQLRGAEVVEQDEVRGPPARHHGLGVVLVAGAEGGVEVGGGAELEAEAAAAGRGGAEGAESLVGLAGAHEAGEDQRLLGGLRGAPETGPGGDAGVVGPGVGEVGREPLVASGVADLGVPAGDGGVVAVDAGVGEAVAAADPVRSRVDVAVVGVGHRMTPVR
jgi:hypothetical protein